MSMKDFVANEHMEHMFHEIVTQLLKEYDVNIPENEMMEMVSIGCSKQYNQNMERFLTYAHERDEVTAEKMLETLKGGNEQMLLLFNMVSEIITMLTAYQAAFLVVKERLPRGE